jgi:sarcosine oxidase subunit alpha
MAEFTFEGRHLSAPEGQTVAAALMAHGVRVFGRSAKYHRPRGVRCANGTCSCCAMRVDGLPGVRTCVTPLRSGMCVEREHAFPSADVDLLRAAELAGPALRAGAYYRWFRSSPRLWSLTERVLAAAAGQGELPTLKAAARFAGARCRTVRDVEVLVVGGGVAGLSAGLAASRAGAHTLLVERHLVLGGSLAADTTPLAAVAAVAAAVPGLPAAACGRDVADALATQVRAQAQLELVLGAEVVGWYEEGSVAIVRGRDLVLCEPEAVVLATGGHDVVPPFANGDLPGVMTGSAVQRLLEVWGVEPGRVATVLANGERGYAVALQLAAAGVEVACVADLRPEGRVPEARRGAAANAGIRVVAGVRGVKANGFNAVHSVTLQTHARGLGGPGSVRLASDLVCVCLGSRPADELARQALGAGRYALSGEAGRTGRRTSSAGRGPEASAAPGGAALFLAGGAAGEWSVAAAIAGGTAAGRAAAEPAAGRGWSPAALR